MKILLDTHIILWYFTNDAKLPKNAEDWINSADNEVYYSIVSLWEVAIKHHINPDRMPISDEEFSEYAEKTGFTCLALSKDHIALLKTLHRKNNTKDHHDPFDRMLICQAKAESMMLLTHDSLIPGYEEPCIVYI